MNRTDPAGVARRNHRQERHAALEQPDVFARTPALLTELQELGGRVSTAGWNIRTAAMCAEQDRLAMNIDGMKLHALELGRLAYQMITLSVSLSEVVEHAAEGRGSKS